MFTLNSPLAIEDDLYTEEIGQSYPAIAWHGRYESGPKGGGFFTLDVDAVEGSPDGWETTEIRYGTDPNADLVPVYKTQQLRCVPIGVRKRIIITDEHKNDHIYPWRTAKRNRVDGRFTSHYQIMVMIPGLDAPCVIGLRGLTKTTAWDNDASGRYRNADFPTGVQQLLTLFAHEASKVNGCKLPTLCLWEITLQPVVANGEGVYLQVGNGSETAYMNPFTAQMNEAHPAFIDARFAGNAEFEAFQALRKETVVEWEAEWSKAQMAQPDTGLNALFSPPPHVPAPVEDEIPF